MEYKVIAISAVQGIATDFEKAAEELAGKVNTEMANGWEPLGGVAIGKTQTTHKPYILQAMIKR